MLATRAPIRVLCVDDHKFLTDGLAARINLERDMTCVGSCSSAEGLVERAADTRAQVVLLDLEMPGPDSLDMLNRLKRSNEHIKVIVLSAHVRDNLIDQALKNGAAGYFSKSDSPAALIEGIRKAFAGQQVFGVEVEERTQRSTSTEGAVQINSRLQEISPREMEILRLIGKGLSRADIARQLCRSLKTIDAHHTAIMKKLDIHDRAMLTRFAMQEGLCTA